MGRGIGFADHRDPTPLGEDLSQPKPNDFVVINEQQPNRWHLVLKHEGVPWECRG